MTFDEPSVSPQLIATMACMRVMTLHHTVEPVTVGKVIDEICGEDRETAKKAMSIARWMMNASSAYPK